jgi:serine/threonine protein kinase
MAIDTKRPEPRARREARRKDMATWRKTIAAALAREYHAGDVNSPLQAGDLVAGKYRVDRVLGEGGMGIVVAATHEQLEQRVALKFLLPDLVSNVEVVRRFMREARAAVKIHSEHVARVLDVGATETGTPYMVMEYLDGEDLSQILTDRGPLPVEEAAGFLLEACEAIAEAHSLGIVHRDLKPSNLFVARRPSGKPIVKVLDFGISKVPPSAKDAASTSTTALMGSPLYMSPEQMVAPATVDVRTDVWCLGVVLYEMLSQRLPFEGETMPALIFNVVEKPHVPLRAVRPDLPEGLDAVIDRCLEKKQPQRFASIAELARALVPFGPPRCEQSVERIEHVLGVSGSMPPQPIAARSSVRPRPEGQTFSPTTSQQAAPRTRLLVLPVAFVVLAGAVGGFFALRSGRPSAPAAPATPTVTTTTPAPPPAEPPALSLAPSAASIATPPPPSGSTPPWWTGKAPPPRASARPPASTSAPAAAPTCRVVSFFDADGNKHFKQECP